MEKIKKIFLVAILIFAATTAVFAQTSDTISGQEVTDVDFMVDFQDQLGLLGVPADRLFIGKVDSTGGVNLDWKAVSYLGWYGAAGAGVDVDFRIGGDTKALKVGPSVFISLGCNGKRLGVDATFSVGRLADPFTNEGYYACNFSLTPRVALLAWNDKPNYDRLDLGVMIGLQQSRTAPRYEFYDPSTGFGFTFRQGNSAYGLSVGLVFDYCHRFWQSPHRIGVKARVWGYGGNTLYTVSEEGTLVADEASKVVMGHADVTFYYQFAVVKSSTAHKYYTRKQWQAIKKARENRNKNKR